MVERAEYLSGGYWTPDSGNFIPWTSKNGLDDRANTFMPEFGKGVSYSGPGGTSFGRNTEAFSNSVISQALDSAQRAEAKRQATAEFNRISNPDTYDPTEAPESLHLGEIVGADTIDEKWDPEKWKGPGKWNQLKTEIDTFMKEHGDINSLSKEESYELGKMYAAAAALSADMYSTKAINAVDKLSNGLRREIGRKLGINTDSFADKFSVYSEELLNQADALDKLDEEKHAKLKEEEKAKEAAKETVGSSAPASSRFTADMKGESKVDTTPSKTFEDVKNEFKDESKNEPNRDPLPNVEPKDDYTDNAYKPEFKNDYTNIADIKKAAEQTGADPETVKAIAGAPKFIQTIESKLGDLLLKMGRRAARYNPLTLAVALYESVKNGEGLQKSIDKAIDALGLERDSMSQDEYDALYKEIEGLRSSIDRGDFKISLTGRGPAAATSDATPTDFFDGLLNTDKTDYSGYNAGLKAETASDKDTKEIIVRVYKKDPVLRLLKC